MAAFPKRRNPHPTIPRWTRQRAILVIAATNVLWPVAFAVMGAFIGGTIWCYVSLTMNLDAGFLAIVMGFLTGEGVTMASGERGIRPFMLAVALAFAGWAAGEYILHAQGVNLLPLDGAYLFATLVAAALPIGSLPARKP